jgi:hypothetical protein
MVGAGGQAVEFNLTSKASGRFYQDGVFNFAGSSMLLLPAITLCLLNDVALVGGVWKMVAVLACERRCLLVPLQMI